MRAKDIPSGQANILKLSGLSRGVRILPTVRSHLLRDVSHGISTRLGGVSEGPFTSLNLGYATADAEVNVTANRLTFFAALRLAPERVLSARLTHGREVAVFHADQADRWPVESRPVYPGATRTLASFGADAVISDVPGLHFLITAADCVPLLFVDRRRGVIGAAHAGWRGTALGISGAVVRSMAAEFGSFPRDIAVVIGPSIGPCCYRVGPEVPAAFIAHREEPVLVGADGAPALDLWQTNTRQLLSVGVSPSAIECLGICTACNTETYFSHRAELGSTGRFGLCAGIEA